MALAPAPTKNTAGGTGQSTTAPGASGIGSVPFTRASYLHREVAYDQQVNLSASGGAMPIMTIPAYGYLRSILLKVTLTGAGGTPALSGDNPFSVLTDITLQEPNGSPIYQLNGTAGYSTYIVNKYGGYRGYNEPKQVVTYAAAAASSTYFLRIPVELNVRDAIAALPNQNSAAAFQVRINYSNLAGAFGGTTPTSGTLRIQAWSEEWDQPAATTLGQPNETAPPALNTTQFWSQQTYPYNSGAQTLRLTRVGNYLRNIILIFRTGGGTRDTTAVPPQTTLYLDTQPIDLIDSTVWQAQMSERFGYFGTVDTAGGQDGGVFVYDLAHDWNGRAGFETRNQWIPTLTTTRLELSGTFGATGTLTVLTNDVILSDNVFQGR